MGFRLSRKMEESHLNVWYDEFSLNIGDNIPQKINDGLKNSKIGIIILSPTFFEKNYWTQYEFETIKVKNRLDEQILLPLWYDISEEDVKKFHEPLLNILARKITSSKDNIEKIALEISELLNHSTNKTNPQNADKEAAWDLYVELLTRITTQPLPKEHGDEQTALESVFSLFALTRDVLKKHGRDAGEFSKIAIVVLNQVIRPFTAKWHKESIASAFENKEKCNEFRDELERLQHLLVLYTRMLSDMAGVEELTKLEEF